MPETPLLGLPLIAANQAQKHITHNEALLLLDAAIQLSVASRALASPPAAPADGDRYLVPASPAGSWAGQAGKLALFQGGGWVFLSPRKGWRMWVEAEAKYLLFDGVNWRDPVTVPDMSGAPRFGINATADDVNRLAVSSPASLLNHAGSDHRLKLNKNAPGDTASLIYQTGWSGRAELGLTGNDDFALKVSADGAAWRPALVIDRASGAVSMPNTPPPAWRRLFNQSLAAQGGFAADSYLSGSAIAIPAGSLRAGSRYNLVFDVSKTAAGTAAPLLTLRFGATGSLADAALGQLSFPLQTAAADDGRFTIEVTFRSVGAGTAAVAQMVGSLLHTLPATGLSTGNAPLRRVTSPGFDSTLAGAVIGVSVNGGLSAAWTVSLVQASLENLA